MKQIIVPSDLSETSLNAFDYAINLAAVMDARLTVVHVYHPMPVSMDGVTVIDPDIQANSQKEFERLMTGLQVKYADFNVVVDHEFLVGFTVERILAFAAEQDAYLIAMGTTGSSLMKNWFGSVSVEIMKKSDIPVLLIPPHVSFRMIENIMYADDFTNNHDRGIQFAKDLLAEFLSNLYCLHIRTEDDETTAPAWVDLSSMKSRFEGVTIAEVDLKSKSVVEGLLTFSQDYDVDIVIMPSEKKGFVYNLFNKSITREMSLNAAVPLLVVH